jgi:hypothetical protein
MDILATLPFISIKKENSRRGAKGPEEKILINNYSALCVLCRLGGEILFFLLLLAALPL